MKKSEELKHLSKTTESDWKAWTYHFKGERWKRQEYFEEHLPKIKELTTVEERPNGSYTFEISGFGKCDLFPKKNTVLIRKQNKWIRGTGMEWIFSKIGMSLIKC